MRDQLHYALYISNYQLIFSVPYVYISKLKLTISKKYGLYYVD